MDEDVTPLRLQGEQDLAGPDAQGQWESAAAAVLRKAGRLPAGEIEDTGGGEPAPASADAVWAALTSTTLDDIPVPPIGSPRTTRADGAPLPEAGLPGSGSFTRGVGRRGDLLGWDVRVRVEHPGTTADDVLAELESGANSLWLRVAPDSLQPEALPGLLGEVRVDLAPVVLDAPHDPVGSARALLAAVPEGRLPDGVLGRDPWSEALRDGDDGPGGGEGERGRTLLALAELALPAGARAVAVDGTAVADLGGSDVQELAFTLAAGVAALRVLTGAGHDAGTAARLLTFRYAVTDEQFVGIAKLRAARRLWARVLELCGVPEADRGQEQHAVTSRAMLAAYDPYTNLLRTTVAAFAAGTGGAGALTVVPFDDPRGRSTPFSRRLARNISALLIEESHVAVVTDPAGGAPAVERLTDDLATAAWEAFTALDGDGGIAGALDSGALADALARTRETRAEQVARRARPITGLTEFPQVDEVPVEREPHPESADAVHRHGAAFEALRDDPVTEPVFLATPGPLAASGDRARFVTNLLAAGALGVTGSGPCADTDALVAAWREAGAPPVVVLASSDRVYAEWGADAVRALRDAGAAHVVSAGKADLGADARVAVGDDVLALLRDLRERVRSATTVEAGA